MANRYWIGGSGNWSDPSHWSENSGGAWGASVPTLADDVFFDNYSHLGPELVLNNTFDSDTWWGKNGTEITISGGVANYDNTPSDSTDGIYAADVLTIGNRYKALWEVKNYVAGSVVWTDGNSQIGTPKSANGVYESIYTTSGTAIWPMGSSADLALDNVYVREYFSLNVNADVSINCRSFICQPDVSAQILSTTYDVYINGDISLNSNTIFSITNSRDIVLNSQGTSYISIDASVFSVDRMYFNGANAYIFNHDLSAGIKLHSQWQSCDIDFNDYDITCDEIQFTGCDHVWLGNGTITVLNPYFMLYLCDVSEQNSTVVIRQGSRSNVASIDRARFNNLVLDGSLVFSFLSTTPDDVYINNLNIVPNSKIKFSPQRADGTRHSYYIKNLTALGTPDSSIILKCTNDGSTSSFIFQESNPYFRIKNAYISDISTSTSATLYALDSSNAGRTAGITFTDQPYEYINYYWVGNGGNWSDVSHWAPTSGGTPASYVITPSDNLIFDANSFDTSATLHLDVSSFKSIRMTNIDNSIYFMPYNDLYCNGDFVLSPRVEFLFSSYYTFYFYGIGDCSLCTGGINFLSHFFSFKTGNYILYDNLIQYPYSSTAQILLGDDASLDLNNYDIITSSIHEDWDANGGGHLYLRNGMLSTQGVDFYRLRIFPGNSTIKLISNFLDETADQNTTWGDFSGAIKQYNKIWFSGTPNTDYVYNMDVVYPLQVNINILEIDPGIKVKFDANDYGYIKVYNVSTFIAHGTSNASIGIFSKTSDQQFKLNYTGDSDVQADYLYVQDCSATPENIWSAGNHGVDLGNNSGWKFRHHRDIPPVYYRNSLLDKFRYNDVWGIVQSDPYIAQYMSVYNAMTTKPDASLALAQDTMITSLVNANLYDRFDLLYILASHTNDASEAYLDWINPTGAFNLKDPSATNPTFQAYRGVTGDDATDWLDTDFIPVQHCTNTSTNSFTLGVYINTINAGGVAFGAFSADTPYCRTSIQPAYSTVQQRAYINSEIIVTSAIVPSVSTGLHLATRTASNQVNIYMHDVCTGTSTVASNRANSTALSLLAQKITDGTHDNFFGSQVAIAFLIDGVNNDDVSILNNIFSTYVNTISDYA